MATKRRERASTSCSSCSCGAISATVHVSSLAASARCASSKNGQARKLRSGISPPFPLPSREREGTREAGRVRGLAQDKAPCGTNPLTFPLLCNGPLPLPQGEREQGEHAANLH